MNEELSELLSSLNSHHVRYLIVGAHALAFHGVSRFTEDVDFFVERNRENIERLAEALRAFGIEMPPQAIDDMSTKERGIIFVGRKPNRADFLNFVDGLQFESADRSKVAGVLAGQPVSFLSLEDYAATKRASGRPKDLSDLELLRSVHSNI